MKAVFKMKKIFLSLLCFFMAVFGLYATTGVATIEPAQLPNNGYGYTITINFYPANTVSWINGNIQIDIPQQFPNAPGLIPTDYGYVEATIMRGGTNPEPVSVSNILVEGWTITINALTFSPGDFLKVIYGSKSGGGYGIGTPMTPGLYFFNVRENPTGANQSVIEVQPSILISNLAIYKSASSSYVMAKDTLTYYITYSNLSSVHQLENVYIWDTIPSQFNIIQILPTPAFTDGNFVVWDIGTMMYMAGNNISINLYAKDGIIKNGLQIVNSVSAAGNDMYGNTYNANASNTINVYGVDFDVVINAMPLNIYIGQNMTVIMQVTNNGNTTASYVKPDSISLFGSGNANLLTGPHPTMVNTLLPSQTASFTWTYSATLAGEISFSARAMCYEGPFARMVYSAFSQSNFVTIVYPPTSTPTKTFTPLPTSTATFSIPTETETAAITITFTSTPTQTMVISTETFTSTQIIQTATKTFTPTDTATKPVIPTATQMNTPIATKTTDEQVYLDRNYIMPEKGEKVRINYRLPESGEVVIKIYNLSGELMKILVKNYQNAGMNSIEWDAKNEVGKVVGRGIYFIHIKQNKWNVIKKIIVMK